MIKTKEMLQKENDILKFENKARLEEELRIRTVLSELLGSYTIDRSPYQSEMTKKVNVQSWEGIAFLMGKLKSDATLSNLIKDNDELRQTITHLHNQIEDIKNPKEDGRKV